jgi:hypothetical protein
MVDFLEEISGFVFPQLGVIEMDRFGASRGPAPAHQRERSHKENNIHEVCKHIERGKFPFEFSNWYSVISLARLSDNILAQLKE